MILISILGIVKLIMKGVDVKALSYILVIGILVIALICVILHFRKRNEQALIK